MYNNDEFYDAFFDSIHSSENKKVDRPLKGKQTCLTRIVLRYYKLSSLYNKFSFISLPFHIL